MRMLGRRLRPDSSGADGHQPGVLVPEQGAGSLLEIAQQS